MSRMTLCALATLALLALGLAGCASMDEKPAERSTYDGPPYGS